MGKLSNPDNWELVYAECRDEHVWAYIGPEPQPWKLAEDLTGAPVWDIKGTPLGQKFEEHIAKEKSSGS